MLFRGNALVLLLHTSRGRLLVLTKYQGTHIRAILGICSEGSHTHTRGRHRRVAWPGRSLGLLEGYEGGDKLPVRIWKQHETRR